MTFLTYFESRIPVNINDFNEIEKKIDICEKLDIKNIIFEPKNGIEIIPSEFRKRVQNKSKINIFFRINLRINKVEDFREKIKKYRNFPDILSIESLNREVQLQSAKDSRVDIVSFSDPEIIKTITPGVISLTKQNNSFIEFSLAPIMVRNKAVQSKNFRNLYKFTQLALKLKANWIISGNFSDLFDYRHPRALLSICNSLLGIPMNLAKKAYISNPRILVEKTRNQSDEIFEPGVKLV
ncbi:MAG: RNase P subunit p30 family protein [Promethearchaeota archaeon]|jgi:RNase P/RNase MRP subunit p30